MKMGYSEIIEIIPQRPPFLFVDGVIGITPGESIVAFKNVTANESFFRGHFPGKPIMPGVLILEALAQAGDILCKKTRSVELKDMLTVLARMNNVKFRGFVKPGDTLVLESYCIKSKNKIMIMEGRAFVGDKLVAEAEMKAMFVNV